VVSFNSWLHWKTQTLNFDIKVVANISEDGSILQETTSFFMSDGQGGFYKVDRLVENCRANGSGRF